MNQRAMAKFDLGALQRVASEIRFSK